MLLLQMISLSFNFNYLIKICVRLYNYIYSIDITVLRLTICRYPALIESHFKGSH